MTHRLIKWHRMQEVYTLAREKGVSFSLHYEEGPVSFYFSIESTVEKENWVGKSGSFDYAVDSIVEWMNNL